jgi:hypothetical protein
MDLFAGRPNTDKADHFFIVRQIQQNMHEWVSGPVPAEHNCAVT